MKIIATPIPVYLLRLVCVFGAVAVTASLSDANAQSTSRTAHGEKHTLPSWEEAWLDQWFFRDAGRLSHARVLQFIAPAAVSGPSTWNGGVGNWSNGAMWTPIDPPNSAGADVFVDGGNTGSASVVSVDGNFTVGRLTIDAGDTVNILDNRSLTVTNTGGFTGAGSIVNNGSLALTTQGNQTTLSIASAVSLSGTGTLTLARQAGGSNSFIRGGGTLTNSSTIQGEGSIGLNETGLVNLSGGVIQANVTGRMLVLDPNNTAGLSNSGILRAANGGVLQLTGSGAGDFINTGAGSIEANGTGSEVQLHTGARISGGVLSTSGGGVIRTLFGNTAFLDGITLAGNFVGTDNSTTVLSGTITNNGDFSLNTGGNLTNLRIDSAATLTGAGTVTLARLAGGSNSRISGGGTLTNASTIQGEGNVGVNETALVNQSNGIMQANVSGRVLTIDPNATGGLNNAGVLRATGGGVLQLTGSGAGDFINTGAGSIQANGAGSEVQLHTSARVSGGTLSTSDGGVFRSLFGNTVFLDSLALAGTYIGNDNSTTVISGTINNSGSFMLSTAGNFTNLRIDTAATLTGAGTVTLARTAGGNNARITGSGTLTNQSTIQGEGQVGANEATIVNTASGIVQANVSGGILVLDSVNGTGTFVNQGLVRAMNGGVLQLSGSGGGTFNNAGGIIRAEAGSEVQLLNSVTISGGTLSTLGAGALLRTLNSHTVTLDNLTIAGTYTGSDNSTTILTGAINNTGDITLTTDGNFTNLRVNGAATLQAGGTVTLTRNAMVTGSSNARINGGGTLTNASIIQGEGNVASNETTIVNQSGGVIQANVMGRTLVLDAVSTTDGFTNAGVLRATNGGLLQFTGSGAGDFTNVGSGTIQALGAGSQVQLVTGAVIRGGTLMTSDGGIIRTVNSNSATLDTLTNAGNYVANDNSTTFLVGTLTNTGNLTVTTDGNFTDLRVDGNVTLTGIGTVTLTRNSAATGASNARIRGSGTLTNQSTIQGEGTVGTNDMSLVNDAGGVIQANIAGRSLVIDPANVANSYVNSGILRAIDGGFLVLSGNGGGDFNNTGTGTIQAVGAGSEVRLVNNATIRGGTLISSGGGLFRTANGQTATLENVTNPGNYIANDNSNTILVGTITNTGDMSFTTDGNFTHLRINSDVTLTGSGTVTLTRNPGATGSSNARIIGGGTLRNASTIQGEGSVGANETTFVNLAAGVIQANVTGRGITLDPSTSGGFMNAGVLRASNGGTLTLTGNGGGTFTNNIAGENGTFEALDASSLFMDGSAILTNNVSGVLTGGRYRAAASGNGATITIRGGAITQLAAGTEVELSGAGSVFRVDTTALESTLALNNGILRILGNRNYTNVNGLTDNGIIELGGGIFNAPSLTIGVTGELFGFGTVNLRPTNSGLVRSNGGTLTFVNGIEGGSGTVRTDASSTMDLSGGTAGSSADFLINNGSLALGANNFTVAVDYTNANFGVGNTFNHRANVSGMGLILAAGNVGQALTGNLTSGSTATPLLAFGNVHVGDAPSAMFRVNNTGTSGPSLRGAFQTSVNGGNITDARLTGSGVLAGNWGPIGLGGSSDEYTVTFNASSAGALSGQILHIGNNFDNVGDQNLSITGAAFRYANPTAHTPAPVVFGNFHVGDVAPTMFLSLTNNVPNDGFSEALDGMIGSATGGVLTNSGSFALLAPGATNNNSLSVGISTANAGSQNGTATIFLQSNGSGSSGLGITTLPSQTVNVTGAVFRYANPTIDTPTTVAFGIRHVGESVTNSLLSITNNVPADGFSESLNASIGGATGGVTTNGGSFTGLAPGATNSTSLGVGINTATAGIQNGTATVSLVSNGTGSSGLGLTNLPSQTINVTGQVNFYADPVILFTSGAATLIMNSATSYALTFGMLDPNSGTYMASLDLVNFLHHAVFQDTLGGTFDVSAVNNFLLSGFASFADLGPGGTRSLGVSFDSSSPMGFYSNTLTFNPTSANASSTSNLAPIQLNLQAQVVPEPSTWAMLASGGALFLALQRFRRRRLEGRAPSRQV